MAREFSEHEKRWMGFLRQLKPINIERSVLTARNRWVASTTPGVR